MLRSPPIPLDVPVLLLAGEQEAAAGAANGVKGYADERAQEVCRPRLNTLAAAASIRAFWSAVKRLEQLV
jgi:hypothetical protein